MERPEEDEANLEAIAKALMAALEDALPAVLGGMSLPSPEELAGLLATIEGPEGPALSEDERSLLGQALGELAATERPAPAEGSPPPPKGTAPANEGSGPGLPPLIAWIEGALQDERVKAFSAGPAGVVPRVVWVVLCEELQRTPLPQEAKSSMFWAAAQVAWRMQNLEGMLVAAEHKRVFDGARGDVAGVAWAAELAAVALERQGNTERALALRTEEVLPALTQLGDERRRVRALVWIGDQLQHRGRMDEALGIRRQELPIREELGQIMERAVVRTKIADVLMARGEHRDALHLFRDALRVLRTDENPRNKAITLGKIARLLSLLGEHGEALRIRREQEIPIHEQLGDEGARAGAAAGIAETLQAQGHLAEALRVRREEELPVRERLGGAMDTATTMGRIADLLLMMRRFEEALTVYEQAGQLFQRAGAEAGRIAVESRIADVLEQQGHIDEALRRRRLELAALERAGDERGRAVTMAKIGESMQRQGKGSEALEILRRDVLPVLERFDMLAERGHLLGTIGNILLDGGKPTEALRSYREALPLVQRTGDLRVEALLLCRIAAAHGALSKPDEAIRILTKEAAPLLRRTGNPLERAHAMRQAAEIHEARRQLDAAIRILKEDVVGEMERLGDEQGLIGERARLALVCLKRNGRGDRVLARDLLRKACKAADARGMTYAQEIRKMQKLFKLEPS